MKHTTYYVTTTAPYVNADPHIGFGIEIVAADVLARYHRMLGEKVIFGTGTDEHGRKIYEKAKESNKDPQEYCDEYAVQFKHLRTLLHLSVTHFQRTTDPKHMAAAQEFWKLCDSKGDIYKKLQKIKYCVGCEMEKTDSELRDGVCELHPNKNIEMYEEENYFFRFSAYQQQLLDLYKHQPEFVRPAEKMSEIQAFVERGLRDFSISRLKGKMPWGVPVPGDADHVMYVWFDALVFYISTLGWPKSKKEFEEYWPVVQVAGKDNLRQQSAMWQAMLLSAGLPTSKQILINGFISVDGQKMSKSLGNVISPSDLVQRFGVDGSRFLLLDLGPVSGDMDASWKKFTSTYNSFLANGLGNTVARVAALCEKSGFDFPWDEPAGLRSEVKQQLEEYRFDLALGEIWVTLAMIDKRIESERPWELAGKKLQVVLTELVAHLRQVGYELQPFLPETAEAIVTQLRGPKIKKGQALFVRIG